MTEEPISVRVTRLSNIILGRSAATSKIGKPISEALGREGLLDAFCLLYNECNKDILKKKDKNINDFIYKYRDVIAETNKLRVNIEDFSLKNLIGKGYFGNVYVGVEHTTKDVYAIKKIRKCSTTLTSQVKEERDIMANSTSEWITSLQYAFQDSENLYLVMEYVPGGDLLSLMIRTGVFDEDLARFYLAEMTIALNTLHTMGYVHRDIKPENILVDRFGHLKLADFGSAMHLNKDGNVISISPVGTPDYIAPELLQTLSTLKYTKSVHNVTCDYWSMGIIGYELLTETTPFHEDNVHETYSKILSHCDDREECKLDYPSGISPSAAFCNLIDNLVTKPEQRLTYQQIVEHPFFEFIDWTRIRHQVPPIIPIISGEDDTSNFEDISKKGRRSTFTTTQSKCFVNRNDFTGQNLPFLGYGYVQFHDEQQSPVVDSNEDPIEIIKFKSKTKEMQMTIDEQLNDIKLLQHNLLLAQKKSIQTESLEKILLEAKQELQSMKTNLKEKTIELAAAKTDIKTLKSSLKIEEEMRLESDKNVSQILNSTYQKWEKAKKLSEQNYEKQIAEKKTEIMNLTENLQVRENELIAKVDECKHLQERLENYKDMLNTAREQQSNDRFEFDRSKRQLSDAYDAKINELKQLAKQEKELKLQLTDELRLIKHELAECQHQIKTNEGQQMIADNNLDDLKQRFGRQIEENKLLRELNVNFERKQEDLKKRLDDASVEIVRLQEEHQQNNQNQLVSNRRSSTGVEQFHSAHGSLETINSIVEDQLRSDLLAAQENVTHQRDRADRLEQAVTRLEEALTRLQVKSADNLLERQNEKLGDELATVREQAIVERQASRTAHLSLWKLEKQVEELQLDKKFTNRRYELAEEKLKKCRDDRDDLDRRLKDNFITVHGKEEKIKDLQQQIVELKESLSKEHSMWKTAELERMKDKSEIIEHVSRIHQLQLRHEELQRKCQTIDKRSDGLTAENKRLTSELNDQHNELCHMKDVVNEFQRKQENMQQNYDMLKEACNLMEAQLTELEAMHENEVKQNKQNCAKIDNLWQSIRTKDELIQTIQFELNELEAGKLQCETKMAQFQAEINQLNANVSEQKQQLMDQQMNLIDKTTTLYQAQEHLELQISELTNCQRVNGTYERELHILKEENSKLLTELFLVKEEANNLILTLREYKMEIVNLKGDIDHLNGTIFEQKNYYGQREIKMDATHSQYKKLISYLQQKVDQLSMKKPKKTLATVLFGSNSASSKKENISPCLLVDGSSTATLKRLEEDLNRERSRSVQLKEQLLKAKTDLRALQQQHQSQTANMDGQEECLQRELPESNPAKNIKLMALNNEKGIDRMSPAKSTNKMGDISPPASHRFEMTLDGNDGNFQQQIFCVVCSKQILHGQPYWHCKCCRGSCHRRCRTGVNVVCDFDENSNDCQQRRQHQHPESDIVKRSSLSSSPSSLVDELIDNQKIDYVGDIIATSDTLLASCQIFCVHQALENILLFGTDSGLYSYNQITKSVVHINGLNHVSFIATNTNLSKSILIADNGQNLYQCDLRHLQNRAQASVCLKPMIDVKIIEIPFANRVETERWHYTTISATNNNLNNAIVIGCTSSRIVILRFDPQSGTFKPICALDTARPVTGILFTRHSALVSADKFFEIDLNNFTAEEFLNESDASVMEMTKNCLPMFVCRINRLEFLLCFEEFGMFVDEYGSRSRPNDIHWPECPNGFKFLEPLLFVTYFGMMEIIRINRSYSHEMELKHNINAGLQDEIRCTIPMDLPPKLIGDFGAYGVFVLCKQLNNVDGDDDDIGGGAIIAIDGVKALKSQISGSLETFFSSLSSIPRTIDQNSLDVISTIETTPPWCDGGNSS